MVDVIILSNAVTPELQAMTQIAITSCYNGANGNVNIVVIEQTEQLYFLAITIHKPGIFNFNAFANMGVCLTTSDKIVIANNDLIFHDGWLDALLAVDNPVVSSHSPGDFRQKNLKENVSGYLVGHHFSGWCFMLDRKIWELIGGFDEDFEFLCADNSFLEQLRFRNIKPVLVYNSVVDHLNKHRKIDSIGRLQIMKFNTKYNQNLFNYGKFKV